MRRLISTGALVLAAAATGAVTAPLAGAHDAQIAVACAGGGSAVVTFNYSSFPQGETTTVTETVTIDGGAPVTKTVTFAGATSVDTVPVAVSPGSHTIVGSWVSYSTNETSSSGTATATVQCSSPPPGPCAASKINFRWHYSDGNTSGSWSGTKSTPCDASLSMGPQSMEGDLKLAPGATLKAGYDFTIPGNKSSVTLTVANAKVVFIVRCVSGAAPSQATLTVPMSDRTYTVGDSGWYPSGDQHSSLVYQGSITAPDLCAGGRLRLDKGGTFSANVT